MPQRNDRNDSEPERRNPVVAGEDGAHEGGEDEAGDPEDRHEHLLDPVPAQGMGEAADGEGHEAGEHPHALVESVGRAAHEQRQSRRKGNEGDDIWQSQPGMPVPHRKSDGGQQKCDTPIQLVVGVTGAEQLVGFHSENVEIDEHRSQCRDRFGGSSESASFQQRGAHDRGNRDGHNDDGPPDQPEGDERVDEEEDRADRQQRDSHNEQDDLHSEVTARSRDGCRRCHGRGRCCARRRHRRHRGRWCGDGCRRHREAGLR